MPTQRTKGALITSLVIHGGLAIIIAVLLVTQTHQFKDLLGVEVYQSKVPPKPQVRKPVFKPIPKPSVLTENTVAVEPVQVQQRVTTQVVTRMTSVQPQMVSEFANQKVKLNTPVNPNVPQVIDPNTPVPQVVTHVKVPVSDAPDALASSSPAGVSGTGAGAGASGTGAGQGIVGMDRGIASGTVQVRVSDPLTRPPGLTMVGEVGAARDALAEVVAGVMLGNLDVSPLPRGQPGGRIVGRGREIHGVFRFTRLRHHLSDWWADASALNALTKWLNEKTRIQTDMNVEGGALQLTDADVMKSPLLFMTGHDPALARSLVVKRLDTGLMVRSVKDNQFSESEAAALRRYLVEKNGLLVFDDCGLNAADRGMTGLFLTQMRSIMPEYPIRRLANTHEIYHNFYPLGGPPIGYNIFHEVVTENRTHASWYANPPKVPRRNYLEGIAVGNHLSVLVIRRDYMCAMETVSLPSRPTKYSPGVFRFLTNVVIYALTHGQIADYSGYVPEDRLEKQVVPIRAPAAAAIGAVDE